MGVESNSVKCNTNPTTEDSGNTYLLVSILFRATLNPFYYIIKCFFFTSSHTFSWHNGAKYSNVF